MMDAGLVGKQYVRETGCPTLLDDLGQHVSVNRSTLTCQFMDGRRLCSLCELPCLHTQLALVLKA